MQELLNFHQITADIATSGQPTVEQFDAIAEDGCKAVVNLAMHDSENAVAQEGSVVASLGMSYFHVPIPFDQPTAQHLRKFFGLMALLDGEKIHVHCAVNARVSAFMYKYLTLLKGSSVEQATSPLLKLWLPQMDEAWRAIMNLELEDLT